MANPLYKNADGDDFVIWYDADLKEWRAEQWNGLDKNYLHIPAILHEKSKDRLIDEISRHRCAS